MSDLKQFLSIGLNAPPKSIVNGESAGGVTPTGYVTSNVWAKRVLSGALSAGVYKELLSITGTGVLYLAFAETQDATSRQVGLKIIVDGVTIFDAYAAAVAVQYVSIVGVGAQMYMVSGCNGIIPIATLFNSSLSVSIKSSNSETNKVALGYDYRTT